eukprot:Amastigsp_a677642_17.p5 type:complete len:121 gc:universal Amastigsp_a677642_17:1146-1508(+)
MQTTPRSTRSSLTLSSTTSFGRAFVEKRPFSTSSKCSTRSRRCSRSHCRCSSWTALASPPTCTTRPKCARRSRGCLARAQRSGVCLRLLRCSFSRSPRKSTRASSTGSRNTRRGAPHLTL